MTYQETIRYLESFINYEKITSYPYKESLKLERIKGFLDAIHNPQDSLKCIHIAGTKGKGSTCAFIAYILKAAKYKVGLYTSPHLSDFRERIRILQHEVPNTAGTKSQIQQARSPKYSRHQVQDSFEGIISQRELTELAERLKPKIEKYNKDSKYGGLSFFEVYTALAFVYFKEKKVDFAVLETGLGGRLDATNAVNPYGCAITPLSYEHTQQLGNTLREIAMEKAGIIKIPNPTSHILKLIVISAPQEDEAQEVIRRKCKEAGARLYEVGKDIIYKKTNDGFSVKGIFGEYPELKINILGEHQLINASIAIGVIESLRHYNINVGIDSIRNGLYNAVWPGRCEVVSKNPLVVLDGAQNIASSKALKETIRGDFKYKRMILVLGISKDKDIEGICGQFYDLADEVILTQANNPRASDPKELAKYFRGKNIYLTNSVREAKIKALSIAKQEDLILITGSLFVVGEARNKMRLSPAYIKNKLVTA